ncbi:MAG TPA: DHA2 family efflux MFS transporter permease subunit [Candidatus Omnitrophota bacterium]|mgnify:CR=1 FL=1|nr:DHA2 family efflux MFS transporter permease subunit [Candidatus Omnitrophota bacterium]HPS37709.1 DHA2 family efflux MFS transporter permease subunit [Candidatus Omnitrophota bacterium]
MADEHRRTQAVPAEDEWHPRHNPWLIAFSVMLATFMEVLDTSVANVSLPHIAGNLSASNHEATWVLTSYLVSNAIILPATAWFGGFFGRKRFLIICIMLFTVSSVFCGLAHSLGFLIFARVVQGIGGGALQPIAQAVLLESFPREKRGLAMAVFALGVIVAPIIGPTIGGWITDNYSWRWIFLINLPFGVWAAFMTQAFVEDPPYIKKNRALSIDYVGFSLMAIGLGVLQVVLDKGQEVDWFATSWIGWCTAIIVISLVAFVFWELRATHPVVDLRIMKDRNFLIGVCIITVVGAVLYSTTALLPLFLQELMNYTALWSGLVISPRGIGAFLTAILIGRLIGFIDARIFVAGGLALLGITCYKLGHINLEIGMWNIIWPIVGTGIGMPAIFIPLSMLTVATVHKEDMGNATGLFNLMRNIGGSIGIALTTTMLARWSQVHQAVLVSHLTPYDPAYQMAFQKIQHLAGVAVGGLTQPLTYAFIYKELVRQATLMAFVDNFRVIGIACLVCVPSVFLFSKISHKGEAPVGVH